MNDQTLRRIFTGVSVSCAVAVISIGSVAMAIAQTAGPQAPPKPSPTHCLTPEAYEAEKTRLEEAIELLGKQMQDEQQKVTVYGNYASRTFGAARAENISLRDQAEHNLEVITEQLQNDMEDLKKLEECPPAGTVPSATGNPPPGEPPPPPPPGWRPIMITKDCPRQVIWMDEGGEQYVAVYGVHGVDRWDTPGPTFPPPTPPTDFHGYPIPPCPPETVPVATGNNPPPKKPRNPLGGLLDHVTIGVSGGEHRDRDTRPTTETKPPPVTTSPPPQD